jgi:hypothetical protein
MSMMVVPVMMMVVVVMVMHSTGLCGRNRQSKSDGGQSCEDKSNLLHGFPFV